jgi:hypothetical protein
MYYLGLNFHKPEQRRLDQASLSIPLLMLHVWPERDMGGDVHHQLLAQRIAISTPAFKA